MARIISWALTIGLIIIWAIPVAFVGFVSNINSLTSTVKFLSFLNGLPPVVIGIIQGILPPVLLAVLFILLPIVLRMMVKSQGETRRSEIELQLFSRFWLFQVIHGFLIVTLASGLINALKNIGSMVGQLPTLLATKLPTASTFFLQYLALYALTSFGLSISRAVPFAMNSLGFVLSGPTPRKTFKFQNKLIQIALATTWPPICLLLCVGIVYSVIQPVITLFGLTTFCLLYVMYKYIMGYVADQPNSLETGGEFMRRAIVTVFVSLYLELICLAGLFFLSEGPTGGRSKPGLAGGVLMVVLIVLVAVFHWHGTHKRYPARLCHFIDGSVQAKSHSKVNIMGSPEFHQQYDYPPNNTSGEKSASNGAGIGKDQEGRSDIIPGRVDPRKEFDHPAQWQDAPMVWIANDELGIGRKEAERLTARGVKSSTQFATMDKEAKVHVERTAPDEQWHDGFVTV